MIMRGLRSKLPLKSSISRLSWGIKFFFGFSIDFPQLILHILDRESDWFDNFRFFVRSNEAEVWGNTHFGKRLKELQYDDNEYKRHLSTFESHPTTLDAIAIYTGDPNMQLNKYLRNDCYPPTSRYDSLIFLLENELALNLCPENMIVARWIDKRTFNLNYPNIGINSLLQDKGFMSTSTFLNYNSRTDYGARNLKYNHLLIIKINKGQNCLFTGNIFGRGHEQEIILPTNTTIRIEKILYDSIFLCSTN